MLTASGLDVSAAVAWAARMVGPITAVRALTGGSTSTMLALTTESAEHLVLRLMTQEPCFIHRDFQARNVLWEDDHVSGVVDWVETSIGPAWLDVAHCCTNIAIRNGNDVAEAFAAAYVARTGRAPQPYFDVMDIVGFLPPPGKREFITADDERRRLEERLRAVVQRTPA